MICLWWQKNDFEKLKQFQAQRKQLERRKGEEVARCPVDIGSAQIGTEWRVESVLGRAVMEEDVLKLIAFLKKQETNGRYFSKAILCHSVLLSQFLNAFYFCKIFIHNVRTPF